MCLLFPVVFCNKIKVLNKASVPAGTVGWSDMSCSYIKTSFFTASNEAFISAVLPVWWHLMTCLCVFASAGRGTGWLNASFYIYICLLHRQQELCLQEWCNKLHYMAGSQVLPKLALVFSHLGITICTFMTSSGCTNLFATQKKNKKRGLWQMPIHQKP